VGDDEYLDPTSGKVLSFDHRSHAFTGETEKKQALSGDIKAFRTSIEKSLETYREAQYKKDKCTITVYGTDDGHITICLSARNTHLAAYWSALISYLFFVLLREAVMWGGKIVYDYFVVRVMNSNCMNVT
jgi:hypothetical protein